MKFKKYIAVKAKDLEEEFDNAIVALSEQLEYSEYTGQIIEDNVLDMIKEWEVYAEEEDSDNELLNGPIKKLLNGLKSLHKFMVDEKIDYILY